MNIYVIVLALIVVSFVAYFIGTKKDKTAFQFLTEDNGNFSLIRLVVLLSNLSFLFVMIYIAITKGILIDGAFNLGSPGSFQPLEYTPKIAGVATVINNTARTKSLSPFPQGLDASFFRLFFSLDSEESDLLSISPSSLFLFPKRAMK